MGQFLINSSERIFFVMKRLIQMIKTERFVRDEENNIYYVDEIIHQYLNRYTDSKIEFTNFFFSWYQQHYNHEFSALKPLLNTALKTVHLFLSSDESIDYFPLVNIDKDIVAYPNGYHNTRTNEFVRKMSDDVYVTEYQDVPFNNSCGGKNVTFSDDITYFS